MVDEGVFVTDLQTGNPPFVHVGMVAIGHVDGTPSSKIAFVLVVEPLEAVQVVQVPLDRGMLTVDLERVEGLVTASVAGRFKQPE